jgi:hypothetical protein
VPSRHGLARSVKANFALSFLKLEAPQQGFGKHQHQKAIFALYWCD